MKTSQLFSAFACIGLLGCSEPPLPTIPAPDADTCGAAPYLSLIGQSATALERQLILRQVRVIRPGQAVTMDYRPDRLNFEIDATERISRIYCG